MSIRYIFCLMMVIFAIAQDIPSPSFSQELPLSQNLAPLGQTAEVDWLKDMLVVEGAGTASGNLTKAQAKLRALGAAKQDALRLITIAVNGVNVEANTSVEMYELISDRIESNTSGFVKGIQFLSDRVEDMGDGSFIVYAKAGIRLGGPNSVASIALEGLKEELELGGVQLVGPSPSSSSSVSSSPYTGIVINASNYQVSPSLSPTLSTPDGGLYYNTALSSSPQSIANGQHPIYANSTQHLTAYVGQNPLVVQAQGVDSSGNPIISQADANRMSSQASQFLAQARIGILAIASGGN